MNTFGRGLWVVPDCMGAPSGFGSSNPAPYLSIPGTTVFASWWGRDSQGSGSFVSDAVSWVIGP